MKRLRIGVLYGGRSGEHEVSLASAAAVYANLDPQRYERVALRIEKDGRWVLADRPPSAASAADVIEQMRKSLEIIREALEALGATMADVVMTRVYVSDVRNIDNVAVVHGDVFRDVRPASTIVKVEFVDPRILVEVEAEAIVQEKKEKVK